MKDVQQAINAQMNDVAPDLNSDSLSERSSTIYRRQSKYNWPSLPYFHEYFMCRAVFLNFRSNFTGFLRILLSTELSDLLERNKWARSFIRDISVLKLLAEIWWEFEIWEMSNF